MRYQYDIAVLIDRLGESVRITRQTTEDDLGANQRFRTEAADAVRCRDEERLELTPARSVGAEPAIDFIADPEKREGYVRDLCEHVIEKVAETRD